MALLEVNNIHLLFGGLQVLHDISFAVELGSHVHLKTGLLGAAFYWGGAHREETKLRAEIEDEIIDFLEIEHIRKQPVSTLARGVICLSSNISLHGG